MPWAVSVHEVAPPWKPPEADLGAAPPGADTPVPVTTVTLNSGTTRMKKKAPGSQTERGKSIGCTGATMLLAVTAAANVACPGAPVRQDSTPQARHAPPPQDCPPGAVETMTRQLGLDLGDKKRGITGDENMADILGHKPDSNEPFPVKEGPVSVEVAADWLRPPYDPRVGQNVGPTALPYGTRLIGQLYMGEKLVYGRITQAVTPTGDTFPVCMELFERGVDHGVTIEPDNGVIKVRPHQYVRLVDHFE